MCKPQIASTLPFAMICVANIPLLDIPNNEIRSLIYWQMKEKRKNLWDLVSGWNSKRQKKGFQRLQDHHHHYQLSAHKLSIRQKGKYNSNISAQPL